MNQLDKVESKLELKETKLGVTLENLESLEIQFTEKNEEYDTVSSITKFENRYVVII